jgi:histidine triad (HIT) family protein
MSEPCVFCEIVAGREPAAVVRQWPDAIAIIPLNPVVFGHTLVIPNEHVRDFTENPAVSAVVMRRAAELAAPPCNLITSAGREATQSVWHLHAHLVPRATDDGLALPWYSGLSRKPKPARGICRCCGREERLTSDGRTVQHDNQALRPCWGARMPPIRVVAVGG